MRWVGSAALLPLLVLAACSSTDAPTQTAATPAVSRIRQSVARTESAGTAHLVQTSVDRTTIGATATHPESTTSVVAVGDVRFAGPDASLTITSRSALATGTPSTSTSQTVYIGDHVYAHVPPQPTWSEAGRSSVSFPYLGAVPTRTLETTTGPVTDDGSRTVDGQATTEYSVPVPRSVRADRLTDSENRPYTVRFTTAPFTLSVWLDHTGRVVRTSGSFVVTSQSTGSVQETTTATLSAFGQPVRIVTPTVASGG